LGDQYKPDVANNKSAYNVIFKNNLFLKPNSWPKKIGITDENPFFGNPDFKNLGGSNIEDYTPNNTKIIQNKGIKVHLFPTNKPGIIQTEIPKKDILGNPVGEKPSLGAIEPLQKTK
jgi:hypothetical protein